MSTIVPSAGEMTEQESASGYSRLGIRKKDKTAAQTRKQAVNANHVPRKEEPDKTDSKPTRISRQLTQAMLPLPSLCIEYPRTPYPLSLTYENNFHNATTKGAAKNTLS